MRQAILLGNNFNQRAAIHGILTIIFKILCRPLEKGFRRVVMGLMKANVTEQKKTERLYTAKLAAEKWGISYWSLRSMVAAGSIRPIIGIGKGWKFTGDEWVKSNSNACKGL